VWRSSLVAAALAAAACSSNGLQGAVDGIAGDIEALFGASSPPAKFLGEIGAVNEPNCCNFKPDAESPLERTRTAVRALGTCEYSTWGEIAFAVQMLAQMGDGHQSSLVRAEALDALTKIAQRTLSGAEPPAGTTSHEEMIEALKVLEAAHGKDDTDRELTAQVASAVTAISAYPFEKIDEVTQDKADPRTIARAFGTQLRQARGILRRITSRSLEGFDADPAVREAVDGAYVALSGEVIRLSLQKAVLGDAAETTRSAAAHDISALAVAGAAPVLRTALIFDGFASVRREAAVALAAYPADVAVPALLTGLDDEMADVRGAAARSLESVTGETFGDDRTAWIRWWKANGAPKSAPGASR
jgi:hypothetical protein